MLPASVRRFLEEGHLAHVVTLNPDGSPQLSVAWVGVDGDELVIGTIPEQRKLRNLRRDPRIAMSFESDEKNAWGLNHYLVINGTARVIEGGAGALLQRLARVYLGPDVTFPGPGAPPGYVIRISVESASGIGPWAADEAASS